MKLTAFLALLFGLRALLQAEVPSILNYQGRVLQNGQPFDGTGHFVFGIYEGSTLLWTNKLPVPSPLNDPAAAIDSSDAKSLAVRNGVFTVRLGEGDANNAPVGTDVFFKFDGTQRVRTDVKLKVWFSPAAEGPYTKLEPDITFSSVPFAQVAGVSETVKDGAVETVKLSNSAVDSAKIADGSLLAADLSGSLQADALIPPGTVVPFSGAVAPTGWVLCNNALLDGADPRYERLYGVIGTTYGAGTGSQFRLPDMRSRTVVGAGTGVGTDEQGQLLSNRTLGQKFGAEKHLLTAAEAPVHTHSGTTGNQSNNEMKDEVASRTVGVGSGGGSLYGIDDTFNNRSSGRLLSKPHTHSFTTDNGSVASGGTLGGGRHNITQPSIALNYIIKL